MTPQESLADLRDRKVRELHLEWSKRVHRFYGLSEEELSEVSIVPFKAGFDECAKLLEQKERDYDEAINAQRGESVCAHGSDRPLECKLCRVDG